MQVSNWGNFPKQEARMLRVFDVQAQSKHLLQFPHLIARGMGRCYGDSSLGPIIADMRPCRHLLEFDPQSGRLVCEAGVTFEDLLDAFLPQGWFPPVTPGTKFVTMGGAIASDVHGKNHHGEGSFCRHVEWFDLLTADGSLMRCSRQLNQELFWATCGGMGLTGIISVVCLRLKPVQSAYIRQVTIKTTHLEEILHQFNQSLDWTYSVAWIDCLASGDQLGRSVLILGEHATAAELAGNTSDPFVVPAKRKLSVPINFPALALNPISVKLFNSHIYKNKYADGRTESIVDYDTFFYPLDAIHHWNRIYGKRGFLQYQFVLPMQTGIEGLRTVLQRIVEHGTGSFLAVLKTFGEQDGLMSFPMKGYTLALDFPVQSALFSFLNELDRIVADFGGRIYLTKDARMSHTIFEQSYPNASEFVRQIRKWDPQRRFKSSQSDRLGIT